MLLVMLNMTASWGCSRFVVWADRFLWGFVEDKLIHMVSDEVRTICVCHEIVLQTTIFRCILEEITLCVICVGLTERKVSFGFKK